MNEIEKLETNKGKQVAPWAQTDQADCARSSAEAEPTEAASPASETADVTIHRGRHVRDPEAKETKPDTAAAQGEASGQLLQPDFLPAAKRAFARLAAEDMKAGRWPERWSTSDLEQPFAEVYVGSYPSLHDTARALTDLDDLNRTLDDLNSSYPTVQIYYNIDTTYQAIRDCWDVISDPDGTVHLFEK